MSESEIDVGSIHQDKDELKMYRNKDAKQMKNNLLKKTRPYFEICKRNINSEKKKKYEINEKLLETDLNKKVLLELKYHELSSKIGWIQLSIIFASTAITFIQTADGVFVFPESPYALPDGINILILPFSLTLLNDIPRAVLKSES